MKRYIICGFVTLTIPTTINIVCKAAYAAVKKYFVITSQVFGFSVLSRKAERFLI